MLRAAALDCGKSLGGEHRQMLLDWCRNCPPEILQQNPDAVCVLMRKLGLYDLTPALCHLDYVMSDAGGASRFVRDYTLASGGPYCDCGYKKK